MNTASLIRTLSGFTGDARLYQCNPPVKYKESWDGPSKDALYVVVSATRVFGDPETYIFAADEDGLILDWMELDGSQKGEVSHEQALADAGYTVTGEPK